MFCTQCGNKLETEGGQPLVRYCPVCKAAVKEPGTADRQFLKKVGNLAMKSAFKLDGFIDKALENNIRQRRHREKCEIHATIRLIIKFGAKQIGVEEIVDFRQRTDGKVYFGYNDKVLYRLISYEWQGSDFATVSNTNTSGKTKYRERGRTGGRTLAMGAGAIAGSMIAPGVGTIVGTAIGAGGSRKTKTKGKARETSNETSRVEEVEKDTLAQLIIQNIATKEMHRLMIVCNREIDGMIQCLKWQEDEEHYISTDQPEVVCEALEALEEAAVEEEAANTNYTQQLYQLKSLLDAGIITTDEFERKKQQILGL